MHKNFGEKYNIQFFFAKILDISVFIHRNAMLDQKDKKKDKKTKGRN